MKRILFLLGIMACLLIPGYVVAQSQTVELSPGETITVTGALEDSDGDGFPNPLDNVDTCAGHDDALDKDSDGTPDGCDSSDGRPDADGDGIPDAEDTQDNRDTDSDGVENHADACPDTPGVGENGCPLPPPSDTCEGVAVAPSDSLVQKAANAPAGTRFCIQGGTHRVSSQVAVQSGDTFDGLLSSTGERPTVTTDSANAIFFAGPASGATIRDLEITGARGDATCQPECGRGISKGSELTVINIRAANNANQGIGGTGNGLVVRDSTFENNGSPPFYADGTFASAAGIKTVNSARIYDSRAIDNAWNGFWCDLECNNFEVHDSVMTGNGKGGIFYEVSTGPAVFEGNTIQRNGFSETKRRNGGLLITSSQNAQVYGNTFGGNYEAGIRVTEDQRTPAVSNVSVHDNTMNLDPILGCSAPGVSCASNE